MSLTVAIAALCAGILTWFLLARRLTAKPWQINLADNDANSELLMPPARIGLRVFLGVATSLFGLFIAAYYIRMGHGHGATQTTGVMSDWRALRDPNILWLNTLVLIGSSISMQAAKQVLMGRDVLRVRRYLIAGGVFAIVFLIGQLIAWQQLQASGYFLQSGPAVAFFYVLTAVHGLHLLGGLFVWGRTLLRMWKEVELIDVALSVELCTVYWHYLLIVWLVLFALLLYT